jgi:tetratricopeptide (TPR) repeat protein
MDVEKYIEMANMYEGKEDYDRAIKVYTRAIELNPDNAKVYYGRGVNYYLKDDTTNAKQDFNKAIKLGCTDADCYYWLGQIFMGEEKWDGAIQNFNRAIKMDGGDHFTFAKRGHAYVHKENYNAAVNDFSRAIELCAEDDTATEENLAELYNYRAMANHNLRNGAAALADFQEAIRLDPNNSQYQDNLNNANSSGDEVESNDVWGDKIKNIIIKYSMDPYQKGNYFSPNIPYDVMQNAIDSYVSLDDDEYIIFIRDLSSFFDKPGARGFCYSSKALYGCYGSSQWSLPYACINSINRISAKMLSINNGELTIDGDDAFLIQIKKVLDEIREVI